MPFTVELEDSEMDRLLKEGGLKENTIKRREKVYLQFESYVLEVTGQSVETHIASDEGQLSLSNHFSRYFLQMRVNAADDGTEKVPKRQTVESLKSHIKQTLIEKFGLDITDGCKFPLVEKRWKSLIAELVAKGRNETTHHEEVDPETLLKIYKLLSNTVTALKARGTDAYDEELKKIPPKLHDNLNKVLQCGSMLCLMMFEVRRGGENMEYLEADNFQEFDDRLYEFKYIRKCISEAEKNAPQGSNSKCHGVIPFLEMAEGFNPGIIFQYYISLLPLEATKKDQKRYLFPKPRKTSKKFDPHSPDARLYEINMKVGKNEVYKMLPFLCEATDSPKQTNHSVRATAIMYLRRMNFSWEDIIKITGHRSTVTLVKNYDLKLEAKGLAAMAGAIGNGPLEAVGVEMPELQLKRKTLHDRQPVTDQVAEEHPVIIHVNPEEETQEPVHKAARVDAPVFTPAQDDAPVFTPPQDDASVFTPPQDDASVFTPPQDDAPVFTPAQDEAPVFTKARADAPVFTSARAQATTVQPGQVKAPVFTTARVETPQIQKENMDPKKSLVLRKNDTASYQETKSNKICNFLSEPTTTSTESSAAGDELTQAAAFVMGTMAKSVMEGGAQMFNQFLNSKRKLIEERGTTCQSTRTTLQVRQEISSFESDKLAAGSEEMSDSY